MTTLKSVILKLLRINFVIRLGKKDIRVFLFCHGLPERCPALLGHKLPLCYRCIGLIMGIIPVLFIRVLTYRELLLFTSIILLTPITLDGVTQNLGLRRSNNFLRFTTGLMGGLGLFLFLNLR